MRALLRILIALAVTIQLVATRANAQADTASRLACAPPSAARALVERFRDDALAPDSAALAHWPEGLPVPAPAEVLAETNPEICDRVLRAYFASEGHVGPYRDAKVVVVRLGGGFVVEDPTNRAGEWQVVVFLDSALERVVGWLQ